MKDWVKVGRTCNTWKIQFFWKREIEKKNRTEIVKSRPIILNGSESWTLTDKQKNKNHCNRNETFNKNRKEIKNGQDKTLNF